MNHGYDGMGVLHLLGCQKLDKHSGINWSFDWILQASSGYCLGGLEG